LVNGPEDFTAVAASSPPDRVSLPLLENGLDFLASTVAHLKGEPSQRDLKYALLHLASGIELVLKERLRRHDPAQLYSHPERFDEADFAAGNFHSANAAQTVKRLVDVAGVEIADADRAQIMLLRERRNRIEHFGFDDTAAAVTAITARTLGIALDFIAAELEASSLGSDADEELREIREALPELQAFLTDRWQRIGDDVRESITAVVVCVGCGEQAAIIDDGPRCRFCGYAAPAAEGADEYAHVVVGASRYRAAHDGEDWVVSFCPDCDRETLVDQGPTGGSQPGIRWVVLWVWLRMG
jgi:hypothetical protein